MNQNKLIAESYYNKGSQLYHRGKLEKASSYLRKSLKLVETPECWLNLGAVYKSLGDLDRAFNAFMKASRLDPSYPLAYNNMGLIHHVRNNEVEADNLFVRAIGLDSSYADAHWNYGLSLLKRACSGDASLFASGWQEYEWRFQKSGPVTLLKAFGMPWDGRSSGSHIAVLAEQGIGDIVMFARYLELLRAKFTSVTLVCTENLFPVFSGVVRCVSSTLEVNSSHWVPICSLARFFGVVSASGYLGRSWVDDGFGDIAVVWKGNPNHGNDKARSLYERSFAWTKGLGSVKSLQFGVVSKEFRDVGLKDFNDTIRELLSCRLLVAVDTSVVHLAGALGVPCVVIVPNVDTDFRWGLERNDCIWYPSVRVARTMEQAQAFAREIIIEQDGARLIEGIKRLEKNGTDVEGAL